MFQVNAVHAPPKFAEGNCCTVFFSLCDMAWATGRLHLETEPYVYLTSNVDTRKPRRRNNGRNLQKAVKGCILRAGHSMYLDVVLDSFVLV